MASSDALIGRFTGSTSLSMKVCRSAMCYGYCSADHRTGAATLKFPETPILKGTDVQQHNECEEAHISVSDLTCKLTTPAVLCDWLLASISRMRAAVDSPPAMGHRPSVYESVDTPALCTDFPCTKCRHNQPYKPEVERGHRDVAGLVQAMIQMSTAVPGFSGCKGMIVAAPETEHRICSV